MHTWPVPVSTQYYMPLATNEEHLREFVFFFCHSISHVWSLQWISQVEEAVLFSILDCKTYRILLTILFFFFLNLGIYSTGLSASQGQILNLGASWSNAVAGTEWPVVCCFSHLRDVLCTHIGCVVTVFYTIRQYSISITSEFFKENRTIQPSYLDSQ